MRVGWGLDAVQNFLPCCMKSPLGTGWDEEKLPGNITLLFFLSFSPFFFLSEIWIPSLVCDPKTCVGKSGSWCFA